MKVFLVVLLALSAVVAYAQEPLDMSDWQNWEIETYDTTTHEEPGLISGLADRLLKKLKANAQRNIDFLQAQLDKLVNKFVSEVMFLSEFALMNAENLERNAKAKLILAKDTKSQKCGQDYLPKLEDAVAKGKKDLENCIAKALADIASIKDKVQKYIDAIKNEMLNLLDIVLKCVKLFRPIATTKCILENIKIITSSVSGIVSSAYKALQEASGEFSQIVSNAQACIKGNTNETENNVKSITGHIDDCLHMSVPIQEVH